MTQVTLYMVVDVDGTPLAWSCAPHGAADAMDEALKDVRRLHPLTADRRAQQVQALGTVEVTLKAANVHQLARACAGMLGGLVRTWTRRVHRAQDAERQ